MRILTLIHGKDAGPGVLGEEIEAAGAEHEVRSYALGNPPAHPLGSYDAALVMGGSMNVHEVDGHPWLNEERHAMSDLLDAGVPLLGICLGSQLLAAVSGGTVSRVSEPEIGWYEVETTEAAASDPVLGSLPSRFTAYQWHSYCSDSPARRGRARDQPGLPPGLPARGQRLGHAVPRRGDVGDLQRAGSRATTRTRTRSRSGSTRTRRAPRSLSASPAGTRSAASSCAASSAYVVGRAASRPRSRRDHSCHEPW